MAAIQVANTVFITSTECWHCLLVHSDLNQRSMIWVYKTILVVTNCVLDIMNLVAPNLLSIARAEWRLLNPCR